MEKINVNAMIGKDYSQLETEQGNQYPFQQGDIVEGIITDVSDMISITFNDKEVKAPQSAVQNAKEGQVRKFEIKDISNKSIVLREVGTNTEGKASGVLQTNVFTGGKAFSGSIREKASEEMVSKTEQVHSQMEKVRNTLTLEDYINIKELAPSPEESSSEEFEKNLERIKEQRQFTEKHIQKQIERLDSKRENIERTAIQLASGNAGEIAKRLQEADLPVTKANIERVSTALEMASQVTNLTDAARAYLMDNEMEITPENLYKASYSGSHNKASSVNDTLPEVKWEELKPKVVEFLKREGIEANSKNLEDAKWLLSKELPVTGENLEILIALDQLKINASTEQILNLCIQGMKEGNSPEKTDLIQVDKSLENIKKTIATMDLLQQLPDEAAEQLAPKETISLNNISWNYDKGQTLGVDPMHTLKNITARRQLEEVRQKLTMENCYHLYQQGIEVDTESLNQVISQLRALEESYYTQYYEKVGITPDAKQLTLLSDTNQVVGQLRTMPDTILAASFSYRNTITLTGLYELGISSKEALTKAPQAQQLTSYDTLMTSPRKDLGDSMKKAFASVDSLLEEIGMEATDSNRQAVRILGYNTMEITKEQVTQMKAYQHQVQQVIKALTPEVAVSLIREGENPLQAPLTELSERLETIQRELGTTSEERFSEYLYKLDQKKGITQEEREAYIGVYRLLYQVEKSDGAAVGAVVKANQELTLGNLLTAIRSKKKEGMEIAVDETFGGVDAVHSQSLITQQINQIYLGREMTHQVYEQLEPELIDRTYEKDTMESFMDLTINQMYEESRQSPNTTSLDHQEQRYQEFVSNYSRTKEAAMLVANGQVVNANQLEAASHLMVEGSTLYQQIKDEAQRIEKSLSDRMLSTFKGFEEHLDEAGIKEQFIKLKENLNQMFEEAMSTKEVSIDQINKIGIYQNCIRLAGSLTEHQTFEIPIVVDEKLVNLKVKLVEGQQEAATVKLHMSSQEYGTLDAMIMIKDHTLQGYLICDNRRIVEDLTSNGTALRQEIESLGLSVGELTITMNRKTREFYRTDVTEQAVGNKPSNQTLYQLAKIFVKYAKQAMTE